MTMGGFVRKSSHDFIHKTLTVNERPEGGIDITLKCGLGIEDWETASEHDEHVTCPDCLRETGV